jgi:hypothetical protein
MIFWVVTLCALVGGDDVFMCDVGKHLQVHMVSQPRRPQLKIYVRFQVLIAVSMKMVDFWVVAPYSLVDVTENSDMLALSIITLMMEAASTSEPSINFYQIMWQKTQKTDTDSSLCPFVKL